MSREEDSNRKGREVARFGKNKLVEEVHKSKGSEDISEMDKRQQT